MELNKMNAAVTTKMSVEPETKEEEKEEVGDNDMEILITDVCGLPKEEVTEHMDLHKMNGAVTTKMSVEPETKEKEKEEVGDIDMEILITDVCGLPKEEVTEHMELHKMNGAVTTKMSVEPETKEKEKEEVGDNDMEILITDVCGLPKEEVTEHMDLHKMNGAVTTKMSVEPETKEKEKEEVGDNDMEILITDVCGLPKEEVTEHMDLHKMNGAVTTKMSVEPETKEKEKEEVGDIDMEILITDVCGLPKEEVTEHMDLHKMNGAVTTKMSVEPETKEKEKEEVGDNDMEILITDVCGLPKEEVTEHMELHKMNGAVTTKMSVEPETKEKEKEEVGDIDMEILITDVCGLPKEEVTEHMDLHKMNGAVTTKMSVEPETKEKEKEEVGDIDMEILITDVCGLPKEEVTEHMDLHKMNGAVTTKMSVEPETKEKEKEEVGDIDMEILITDVCGLPKEEVTEHMDLHKMNGAVTTKMSVEPETKEKEKEEVGDIDMEILITDVCGLPKEEVTEHMDLHKMNGAVTTKMSVEPETKEKEKEEVGDIDMEILITDVCGLPKEEVTEHMELHKMNGAVTTKMSVEPETKEKEKEEVGDNDMEILITDVCGLPKEEVTEHMELNKMNEAVTTKMSVEPETKEKEKEEVGDNDMEILITDVHGLPKEEVTEHMELHKMNEAVTTKISVEPETKEKEKEEVVDNDMGILITDVRAISQYEFDHFEEIYQDIRCNGHTIEKKEESEEATKDPDQACGCPSNSS